MRCRLIADDDFEPCLDLVHNSFEHCPEIRRQMPHIWSEMLATGCLHAAVVEDTARSRSDRLVAVTMAVYVQEAFLDSYLANPIPGLSKVIYEHHLAGRNVALQPKALRAANAAGGVSLVFLHYGARFNDPRDPLARQVGIPSREMIVVLHAGYRTKRVLQEVVGVIARDAMQRAGFRLLTDFQSYLEAAAETPAENDLPYLFICDPDGTNLGSPSFYYFTPATPRFGFTYQQQVVLLHALFNEGDERIADSLSISIETVRKHWRAIYDRVMVIDPTFFPGASSGNGRGPEKRRHLMNYLRFRLEEIRPGSAGH